MDVSRDDKTVSGTDDLRPGPVLFVHRQTGREPDPLRSRAIRGEGSRTVNEPPRTAAAGVSGVIADDSGPGLDCRLQELVLDCPDVEEFLIGLATLASASLSSETNPVLCGITAIRRKRPVTTAGSGPRASAMNELQNGFRDGPCLTALRQKTIVHVPDLAQEHRWHNCMMAVAGQGIGSILAVPLDLAGEAEAVISLYSTRTHGFSGPDITAAEFFATHASSSLRLALRIAHLRDARDDLSAAMQSRTTIDMAIGVIMAQNRCSRDAAFHILARASNDRPAKLRDVAASLIDAVAGERGVSTHFDE
jgi:GAF domain-containing protein